ncbi:AAA family ATPase [Roseomonas sp. OT10]|uniref:GNVR domain-containing protein n=1 Tax=Roseomonas cutis TaxID=2897332 RepID=UPI001E3F261F|nr:GNVR domain-containing protein [Roseomonas sp. OT10]UFN50479.1 AAA family ATPase [Roseomonas sp. OT10]
MLNIAKPIDQTQFVAPLPEPAFQWLPAVLRFARRRWPWMAAVLALFLALAGAYLAVATPQFTATVDLSIDTRRAHPFRQQPLVVDSLYDNTYVESQVEVMRSAGTARALVESQNLVNDPRFMRGPGILGQARQQVMALVARVAGGFGIQADSAPSANEAAEQLTRATDQMQGMMKVRRIGQTSVVQLSVTSPDAELAATLANAAAHVYISGQLDTIAANTRQAGGWLEERLRSLREQAITADEAVQRYKAENNIVDTDKGLLYEREIGELNTQIIAAASRTAETQSRLARVEAILGNGTPVPDATVADTLQNQVIVRLRQQYLDASRREAEWSQRYGASHAAAVNMRNEMAQIRRAIQDELGRIAQTYRSDAEVAVANQKALEARMAELVEQAGRLNTDRILLRSLQSSADTYRSIYENFLQRYTQAMQDQSYPISDARVVSEATVPLSKSSPKAVLVLAGALVLGLGLGGFLAFVREMMDRGLRTPEQLRAVTGADCLGALSSLSRREIRRAGNRAREARPTVAVASGRALPVDNTILRYAVSAPMSPFAEVVRSVLVRVLQLRQRGRAVKVIGCVSALPGEGATTTAANLAQMLAESGQSTLLLDWDMRHMDLTYGMGAERTPGFLQVLAGEVALEDALWQDPVTGLYFLPAAAQGPVPHAAALFASEKVRQLMLSLRDRFDCIVVDLRPLTVAMDAHAADELVDGFVLTTEWGRSEADVLNEALNRFLVNDAHLLGVVFNKVDRRALGRYVNTALPIWGASPRAA